MFFWGFFLESLGVIIGCLVFFQVMDFIITKVKGDITEEEE